MDRLYNYQGLQYIKDRDSVSPLLFRRRDSNAQNIYSFVVNTSIKESQNSNKQLEALIKLQAASTIIQIIKNSVYTAHQLIWKLRRLTFKATSYELSKAERLELIDSFEDTKSALDTFVKKVQVNTIPILCGEEGLRAFTLQPNHYLKAVTINDNKTMHTGNYTIELSARSNNNSSEFIVTLYQEGNKIKQISTGSSTLDPEKPVVIEGLTLQFANLKTDDLLEAKVGLLNDAHIMQVLVISPIYPGKYKILLEKTDTDKDYLVYLGRFYNKLNRLETSVGGLQLLFSKKLYEQNIAAHQTTPEQNKVQLISEVIVDYKKINTEIVIEQSRLPLKLQLELISQTETIELLPLLPEALIADAFGSVKAISDLTIEKGFDPSLNLEVLETVNLNLNIYDKKLTEHLNSIYRAFVYLTKDTTKHHVDPKNLLENFNDKLKIFYSLV